MSDIIKPGGYNPSPYPSPNIWADCNFKELQEGDGGWAFHEDFWRAESVAVGATGATICPRFTTYLNGTNSVIRQNTTVAHSVDALASDDNGMAAIVLGSNAAGIQTVRIAYHTTKFWLETRMKHSATTELMTFVGLIGKAAALNVAVGNLDTDTGVPDNEDVNFIGFNSIAASPTLVNAMYLREDETAQTNVKASAHTIVADTFFRVGMKFDGEYLKYYVNGAQVGSSVHLTSSALPSTFPDQSVGLTLAFLTKSGDGSAADIFTTYDWIKAAYQTPL